jgi:hypothetical protein
MEARQSRGKIVQDFCSIEGYPRHERGSHDVLRHTGSEWSSVCPVDIPNFWFSQGFAELCIAQAVY